MIRHCRLDRSDHLHETACGFSVDPFHPWFEPLQLLLLCSVALMIKNRSIKNYCRCFWLTFPDRSIKNAGKLTVAALCTGSRCSAESADGVLRTVAADDHLRVDKNWLRFRFRLICVLVLVLVLALGLRNLTKMRSWLVTFISTGGWINTMKTLIPEMEMDFHNPNTG